MKTAQELQALSMFAQELVKRGYDKDQLKTALAKQGSDLAEVGAVIQYGPEKVVQHRQATQEYKKPSEMSDQEYWASRLGSLSVEEKQKMKENPEYAKRWVEANTIKSPLAEGIKGGIRAALTTAVSGIDQLSGGALGWVDKKLGSPAQIEQNKQWLAQELNDMGGVLGGVGKAAKATTEIAGAMASPVARALMPAAPVGTNLVGRIALGGAGGSLYGGLTSGFKSDFDLDAMKRGATIGGIAGATFPVVEKGVQTVGKIGQAGVNYAKKYVPNVMRRLGFSETPESIAANVAESFGGGPLMEETGAAVRKAGESINQALKAKQGAMYDKARSLAGNPQITMTKKGSELGKAIAEISKNTTKSGRKELARIWGEIGHTTKNAPNYEALKTLKSSLSEKSASASGTLNASQWKTLQKAVEKDIERGVGQEAYKALKEADAYFAKQLNDPNSIASALDKILKTGSDSVVGNRVISSATGKAWKASDLNKILQKGEAFGLSEPIRASIRRNITTRAQFNRMSPDQKAMIYGDMLPQAEKIFNSDLATTLEKALGGVGRVAQGISKAKIAPATRPVLTLTNVLGGM